MGLFGLKMQGGKDIGPFGNLDLHKTHNFQFGNSNCHIMGHRADFTIWLQSIYCVVTPYLGC